MDPAIPDVHALIEAARHLNAGKYFQLAAYVVLIFDHILTFSEEVEKIWKRKITGAAILFLINRYGTPLAVIIIIEAYHDPNWTHSVTPFDENVRFIVLTIIWSASLASQACQRFVAFEGASTISLTAICELVMILRVFALFGKSLLILTILLVLWAVQIIISSVGVSTGFVVPLPPGLVGCIFSSSSKLFASLWIAPLATNSVILFLTIYRTRNFLAKTGHTPTIDIFVRDGMIYFFVIFLANLLNTLIYFLAIEDLKSIGAPFSALITATMISRLMLNLRSSPTTRGLGTDTYQQKASIRFMVRTIGNLGEDIEMNDVRSRPSEGSSEDEGMADRRDEVYIP